MNKKEKRKFIYKILEKEIIENDLNVVPYCFGSISYYNSKYFKNNIKKNLKLSRTSDLLDTLFKPFCSRGSYDFEKKEIIIFCDNIPFYDNIISTLQTIFHELFHSLDEEGKATIFDEYTTFANKCDKFIIDTASYIDVIKYMCSSKVHDSYMFEILANLYGISKTEKYIRDNNISCSKYELKKLHELKKIYCKYYCNYDLTKSLNIIINKYKNNIQYIDFDKTIFEYFLTDEGKIKDINSFFSSKKITNLDSKILLAFIRCDKIKKAIENTNLNKKAIDIIEDLLGNDNINKIKKII